METETKTDNELIAEFMGAVIRLEEDMKRRIFFQNTNKPISLNEFWCWSSSTQYHTSWDWLMPVCLKWSALGLIDDEYMHYSQLLQDTVSRYEITPAFKQLVENIKWYNNQKENGNS